jgi:hypothetical protein
LGIFKREKQKKFNGHFAVRLLEDARQSDQNKQQKQCLCRAFMGAHGKDAIYCRAFLAQAHVKEGSLTCVFGPGARQRSHLCRVFFSQAHGEGCHTSFGSGAISCFFLPCVMKKRMAKIIYRALSDVAHGKDGTMQNATVRSLSCALCHTPR